MSLGHFTCPACNRPVFSNGGHQHGCRLDAVRGLPNDHPGFTDMELCDEQRFVNVWDEVTYLTDGDEGDRQ